MTIVPTRDEGVGIWDKVARAVVDEMLRNVLKLKDDKATHGVVAKDVFVRSVVATVVDEVTFNWSRFWAPFFAVSCYNFNPLTITPLWTMMKH